ncbi:MAG: glucoamylase family protein [Vicinamibacterales bacterium]
MWRSGQTLLSDPPPALDSAIVLQPERFASVDELVRRAARLASSPTDAEEGADARAFLAVLTAEASRIEAGQAELAAQSSADRLPVEAWLHDNLHVVREQIRAVRRDLSRAHYRSLPTHGGAPFRSLPRVYALACELAAHTGGRIDMEVLRRFVDAYQGVTTLTIGELWALPSMLRGALLRHLSHLTHEIVERRRQRRAAQRYLAAYQGSVGRAGPRESPPALPPTLAAPFVVQLIHDLRDLPPSASPLWRALENRLGLDDTRIDEIGQHEHTREAFLLLAVSNLIASMRQVAAIDWHDFVEGVSIVDSMLREDPAGAYGGMDFATRDAYRRAVERVAGGADAPETEVAHRALELARASPGNDRRGHVGSHSVSDGRTELERVVGARPTRRCRLGRAIRRHAALAYFASLVTLTFLATGALVAMASEAGGSAWTMAAAGALALVPGSEIAVQVLHGLLTSFVPPRLLPKLDFSEGVPTRHRTLVVVPSMLTSLTGVERLLRDLEVRSLANHAGDVRFALLTDFPDADAEHVEGDDSLVGTAAGGIRVLNERHGHERFLLLHRRRSWNPHAGRWMGWERKRGKLVELNRLLRRGVRGSFARVVGSDAWLRDVRYVVTLDADTQIPAGTIQRLAGAMAHPLNRPDIDPATRRVVRGYGIMQPRVDIDLESAEATVFAAAASGGSGFDPYARAVSDVYQDTFDEGSYVGKGIYDVSAFRTALADRVPDHRLLSHDLFEGLYARTGLCSDIHVIDDYPSHYLAWAVRQHRWTRGDWQIARWLTARVPTESGASVRNVLPWVSRWKIADNLRRSLLPASVVAMCTYGWTAAPGSPGAWTLIALLPLALPSMRAVGDAALSRVRGVPWRAHLHAERPRLRGLALQFGLTTCFLLHHAIVELDAVARTLYRLAVDRRHLLEWESSADASVRLGATRMHTYAEMASSTALGFAILVACLLVAPDRVRYALPLAAGWMFAPELAHLTARPRRGGDERLGLADSRYLRRCARRCWSFFEDLVVAERRFLVPDNYQPDRVGPIASRTSPTNIGLQLVADVAAGDFGYIGTRQLIARVERTTQGLEDLPTYRGHFYNWYDLATLQPLAPAYVSTVDSGNLAAHLLTVRQALDSLVRTTPLLDARTFDGLEDLVDVCAEEASRAEGSDVRPEPNRAIGVLMTRLRARPRTLSGWSWLLTELTERHALLEAAIPPAGDSWRRWSERLGASLAERRAELEPLRPALSWLDRLAPPRIETAWLPPPAGVSAWIDERLASHRSSAGSEVLDALAAFREQAADLVARTDRLQVRLLTLVTRMDFRFLYDERRDLFSIGYNAADNRLDSALYDLLASESRLTSLVAIALDQAPVRHWFKLGRPVVAPTTSTRALVSWSASMFEYLMPALVTKLFPQTLLTRTCRAAVDTHIRYGQQRGVPWGMSEAAYALRDRAGNYQYKAFGVPGLGLKAGLGDELVVAPYASFLAAMLRPATAARNLRALSRMGLEGRYGFYEALDYGRTRPATTAQVVRTYMAHHVGMSLAALDNVLHDNVLQAHFHAEPRVRAVELLLQEQPPVPAPIATSDAPATRAQTPATPSTAARRYSTPHTLGPRAHLLSNGHYMVMLTNAGGGFSAVQDVHVTRWREDAAEDRWGAFLYLRDLGTRRVWSATYQPTRVEPDEYHVEFDTARARYRRRDGDLETILEVTTGLDDRAEARRLTIVNHGTRVRTIEITTYAEVVLATLAADTAHPAFSNLFVRTEAPWPGALLAERRSREGGANHFAVHVLAGPATEAIEHETDRSRFIGRGGTVQAPAALMRDEPLSGTEGFVLDPVFSLRRVLKLGARARVNVAVALGYARTRDDALALLSKYRDPVTIDHAFFVARSRNDIELREFNLSPEQAMRFQRLASRLLFPDARLRSTAAIERNRRPVRELWKHGISGDLPILLVRVSRPEELDLVRELLTAHEYHRRRGFRFDLVILNAHEASYRREVQDELARLSRSGPWASYAEEPGGVFLRQASTMSSEDGLLLEAAARAICDGRLGSVEDQLRRLHRPLVQPDLLPIQATWRREAPTATAADPEHDLEFWNGFGGFGPDGTTYEIRPDEGWRRPLHGPTCSPTLGSDASRPTAGWGAPGPRTVNGTG